jgi:glycosyltransferase involved in cell wall biosynthesis
VHDVHFKRSDLISEAEVNDRLARDDRRYRIGYVGRVHPAKGPLDWISAIGTAAHILGREVDVQAIWMGDGPLLSQARQEVGRCGLEGIVEFPGAEDDRMKVLSFLRSVDVFVFCHNTPESPRCLLEALMSGVPIVGYRSTFAEDLVSEHGGGEFFAIGDNDALAAAIVRLARDPQLRSDYSHAARLSGSRFSDDAVFAHRSALIKEHLPERHS